MIRSFCLLTAASLVVSGCLLDPGDCTTEARFGLTILVRDATTNAPAGQSAVATARDGSYAETLISYMDGLTFVGASERAGSYDISVNSPGYQPWTRDDVEVGSGRCHVESRTVEARLNPIAAERQ